MSNTGRDQTQQAFQQLDNQLCFALYRCSKVLTQHYQLLLKPLGLTYPQYLVMLVLWEQADAGEPCSLLQLGQRLALDSGTLSPLLKRLEEKGLLSRQRSADDERVLLVTLSKQGLAMSLDAVCIPQQLFEQLDEPAERILALKAELEALASHIENLRE